MNEVCEEPSAGISPENYGAFLPTVTVNHRKSTHSFSQSIKGLQRHCSFPKQMAEDTKLFVAFCGAANVFVKNSIILTKNHECLHQSNLLASKGVV